MSLDSVARLLRAVLASIVVALVFAPLLRDPAIRLIPAPHWYGGVFSIGIARVSVLFILAFYGVGHRLGLLLQPDARGRRLHRLDILLLLFFPVYVLYVGTGTAQFSGDTTSMMHLPSNIILEGTIDLSQNPFLTEGEKANQSFVELGDRLMPAFPIGTAVLALPYTAAALLITGGEVSVNLIQRWAFHFAALAMVLAGGFLFFGLRRRYGEGAALATAAVYWLATTAFSCASQAMWNYTGELFFVCAALGLLLAESSRPQVAALAGVAMGGAFMSRPTAIVIAGVLGLITFSRNRRAFLPFASSAAIAIALVLLFNYGAFGHPLGGYGIINSSPGWWFRHIGEGFLGNLISPSRGALIHFPYLIVLALLVRHAMRRGLVDAWWVGMLLLVFCNYVLISLYSKWYGGWSIGPRMMTESAPFIAILTLPLWRDWDALSWRRAPILAGIIAAAAIQFAGIYNPNTRIWNYNAGFPDETAILWSWREGQIAVSFDLERLPMRERTAGPSRLESAASKPRAGAP